MQILVGSRHTSLQACHMLLLRNNGNDQMTSNLSSTSTQRQIHNKTISLSQDLTNDDKINPPHSFDFRTVSNASEINQKLKILK